MGVLDAGTYTVLVSKPGYVSKVINNVSLSSANVTNLDVELVPISTALNYRDYTYEVITTYPNPFHNNVYVELNTVKLLGCSMSIINIIGKEVYRTRISLTNTNIDLSILESGSYMMKFTNEQGEIISIKKIVKL